VKITKDATGKAKIDRLIAVRYGDLIVPSEAEVKEAEKQMQMESETKIIVPESTFMSDFSKLLNNQELSDVTFTVEGKPVYCHKIILAARSEHFKAMFFNGLKESREKQIDLPDLQYNAFQNCLRYIYTGEVSINNPDQAIDIIGSANYFKLERLKALCESVIKNCIEIENAAYILQVASRHDARQLKGFCMHFIMENYDKVCQTKSFEEIDRALLIEVTKEACKYAKQ